jgi:hypothetical protein
MTRRRRPGDQDLPLFGEDWWAADQQLFQDAVTRRTAPSRRRRRAATIRKREATAAAGHEQGMLSAPELGSPAYLDQLIEEIVAAAPPFTPGQRRRLGELLSITLVMSWPKSSTPGQAA